MVKDSFGFVYTMIIAFMVLCGIAVISLAFVLNVEGHRRHTVTFYIIDDTQEPIERYFFTRLIVTDEGRVGLPREPERTGHSFRGWYIDIYFEELFDHNNVGDTTEVFGRFVLIT